MELWEYWSRLPFNPPGDLPYPGTEPAPPVSPALAGRFSHSQNHGILYTLDTAMVYMTLRSVYLSFSALAEQSFCVITCDWHNTHCSILLLYVLINDFLKGNFNLIFVPSPKKKKDLDPEASSSSCCPHLSSKCVLSRALSTCL